MQVISEGFKVGYDFAKISSIGVRPAGEMNGTPYPDAVRFVASLAYEYEDENDGILEKEQKLTVTLPCDSHDDMITVKDKIRELRENGVVVHVNGPIASSNDGSNFKFTAFDSATQFLENNGIKVKAQKPQTAGTA